MRERLLQPAYFLHTRPFKESSALIECFSRDEGLFSCVAKGAKRPKSKWRALVQPFILVQIAWTGKGEVKTVVQLEAEGLLPMLSGKVLWIGFYMNELILNLLHRSDPHPELFDNYHESLRKIAAEKEEPKIQWILRRYECTLLKALGFGLDFDQDIHGEPILEELVYGYDPEKGFYPHAILPQSKQIPLSSGATLLALKETGQFQNSEQIREAKYLMRFVIAQQLGNKQIKSRKVLAHLLEKE